MEYTQEVNFILKQVLTQFTANSGIQVCTDRLEFVFAAGKIAHRANGMLQHPRKNRAMKIFAMQDAEDPAIMHLKVALHEIAHASGFFLNRKMSFPSRRYHGYKREEGIAETTALMLLEHFDVANTYIRIQANFYINAEIHSFDENEKEYVQLQAQKAFDFIIKNWLPQVRKQEAA